MTKYNNIFNVIYYIQFIIYNIILINKIKMLLKNVSLSLSETKPDNVIGDTVSLYVIYDYINGIRVD